MPKYLLDTNACIAIRNNLRGGASKDPARRAARERLIARWKTLAASEVAMSFVTLGELSVWMEKHASPAMARALLDKLTSAIPVADLPSGDGGVALARRYGALRATLERAGNMIPHNDLWIAAHALAAGMTVVTGDRNDFGRVPDLNIEDWTA
jgi:tRNA(fMet)-specific endonuclease VapC